MVGAGVFHSSQGFLPAVCYAASEVLNASTTCVVQVYKPGTGLAFHFDKDEHAMKEKQQMIQPFLSSVLYLTGDSTHERLGLYLLPLYHTLPYAY